jgi:peptidoglycan/LPS O-acetylase OafA/YrhL
LTHIPAISGQSPFVPIVVWAAAVFLIAVAANRSRRSTGTASPDAAGCLRTRYLRTIGLITYPLYLTHNVIGSAIIRVLIDAGLDASLAVEAGLGILVLVCWLICAKIEPAIRRSLTQIFSYFGRLPKTEPLSSLPNPPPGLRFPLPIRAKVNFTGR